MSTISTTSTSATSATSTAATVSATLIDRLRHDHEELRTLLARIEDTPADERGALFEEILTVLSAHEAAERAIVRPLTLEAPQGRRVADSLIREEQLLEEELARMEDLDPASDGFLNALRQLRVSVEDHVVHEEEVEFPRLADTFGREELEVLAERYDRFERVGPTRPHPHVPNDDLGQRLAGPVLGAVDRLRDTAGRLLS